jgi:hypothetical protein
MDVILCELSAFPMNEKTKAGLGSLLNGASYLLFAIACMAFWFGGGLIQAVTQTDRALAEGEGIGLAMIFGGVGALVKTIATRLETGDGMISLSDSLRK